MMERSVLGMLVFMLTGFITNSSVLVHNTNKKVANTLAQKVGVMCGVVTTGNQESKQTDLSIGDTWGKRCNKLVFLEEPMKSNLSRNTPLYQDQNYFHFMYEESGNDAEWYLLATTGRGYVVVENLRYMLADFDPNDPIYFMLVVSQNKGVSYVLSKGAVDHFLKANLTKGMCTMSIDDDVARENCFRSIGLKRKNSQDFLKRDRFLADEPYTQRARQGQREFWDCSNTSKRPANCYSDFAIYFDDVDTHMKYVIDYLIYQLRPYGIKFGGKLPKILKTEYQPKIGDYEDNFHDLLIPIEGNIIYF